MTMMTVQRSPVTRAHRSAHDTTIQYSIRRTPRPSSASHGQPAVGAHFLTPYHHCRYPSSRATTASSLLYHHSQFGRPALGSDELATPWHHQLKRAYAHEAVTNTIRDVPPSFLRCTRLTGAVDAARHPKQGPKSEDVDASASTSTFTSSVKIIGAQHSEPELAVSLAPARVVVTVIITTTITNWITTKCSEDSLDGDADADILQMVLLYSRQLSIQSPLNRVCKLQKCDASRGGTGIREHELLACIRDVLYHS
jgi:hypothetical protein